MPQNTTQYILAPTHQSKMNKYTAGGRKVPLRAGRKIQAPKLRDRKNIQEQMSKA